jgi:hypothetical protein
MWYHLSRGKWDKDYIDSIPELNPNRSHGEKRPRATSVAPTVCQCYIAAADCGEVVHRFYIYEIAVEEPEPVTEDHCVMDYQQTQEHLLTAQVLTKEGPRIQAIYAGYVAFTADLLRLLKSELREGLRFSAEQEVRSLWKRFGEEWSPNFDGRGEMRKLLNGETVYIQRRALLEPPLG